MHQLRAEVERAFGHTAPERKASLTVVSFGFKYGLPLDADLVIDMRFLPNPHWIPELRDHTGREQRGLRLRAVAGGRRPSSSTGTSS